MDRFALALVVAFLASCAAGGVQQRRGNGSPETSKFVDAGDISAAERMRYYEDRIRQNPSLYPLYTQLGLAYLDRARETHDPTWLARARAAEEHALALQDNFESLMAMATIQNYAHRFEDAIGWGQRAAAASVNGSYACDPAVCAALVEAHLGLGQVAEAGKLVAPAAAQPADFHSAVALGKWLEASERVDEAVDAYVRAAYLAQHAGSASFAAWGEAAAAGALLRAGRPAAAQSHIAAAEVLDAHLPIVRLRDAERAEAEGRDTDALALYETLLRLDPDPTIEARAYGVAKRLGDDARMARHFAAAESGLERPMNAGEVYALGPLANLYAEAGTHLDRALALAEENLQWKRDREAGATLAAVQRRLAVLSNP